MNSQPANSWCPPSSSTSPIVPLLTPTPSSRSPTCETHERRYGGIDTGTAVLMYSGWGAKVADPTAYRGTDAGGVLHFPGFSADACQWLLRRRKIQALGVDTLSIDPGNSATFETHKLLNGADRYGIENLANLHTLPATGASITVGLIPFKQGSGGPAKVLANW